MSSCVGLLFLSIMIFYFFCSLSLTAYLNINTNKYVHLLYCFPSLLSDFLYLTSEL